MYVAWVKKSVTTNFDGCLEFEEHGLFEEDFSGFDTESSDFWLEQFDIFASILEKFVDDLIDVDLVSCVHEIEKNI